MAKKAKTKRTVKTVELPKELPIENVDMHTSSCCCGKKFSKTTGIAILLGAVILLLVAINRGWVISAIVNGKPIFRATMVKTLVSKFGTQTIENMITEELINNEAKKSNIVVTQNEIDEKEQEILKSFGGSVTLDDVLKFQGMTKADFDQEIKLQMLLTKLIGKDIVITDEEIATYRTTNGASLTATDEAGLNSEAREALLTQKIGEKIQPWFTELRNKAQIFTFPQK